MLLFLPEFSEKGIVIVGDAIHSGDRAFLILPVSVKIKQPSTLPLYTNC